MNSFDPTEGEGPASQWGELYPEPEASEIRFRAPASTSWRDRVADVLASFGGWLAWKTFEMSDAIRRGAAS